MAETTVTILEQDRVDAENFIEQFLSDKLTDIDVDFTKGGAMRDFAVTAIALVFAYLRKERDLILARQSLLLLGKLTGIDVDDAVDEILSNWYLERKAGRFSRGTVTVYVSRKTDVFIPIDSRFYKTSDLLFNPDSLTALIYGENDMTAVFDSLGTIVAYTLSVPLVSAAVGEEYDIEPGPFVDFTRFNPFVTRVENASKFSGGKGKETTTEMLERAPTAISVRDLNSPRSIDVTLREELTDVDEVVVVGYGAPEMVRDLVREDLNTRIHAGGHVDSFTRGPILTGQIFEGEIGAAFTDPRDEYYVLRDDGVDFEAVGIVPGDVLVVYNALLTSEAGLYIVKQVSPYGVQVSRRNPFPLELPAIEAQFTDGVVAAAPDRISSASRVFTSDDIDKYIRIYVASVGNIGTWRIASISVGAAVLADGPGFAPEGGVGFDVETRIVDYSIGTNSPSYNDLVDRRISGRFTKSLQYDGATGLLPGVLYRITKVSIPNPTGWVDLQIDGEIVFPNRVNHVPVPVGVGHPEDLEYQVSILNPEEAQSGWQAGGLFVEDKFKGETLQITYDTLSGWDAAWSFMTATDRRILCGAVIPRGLHPVYLHFEVPYALTRTALENLDEAVAAEALADFINNFSASEDLDVSDIAAFLRSTYEAIGRIEPLTLYYDLLAPDGRVIYYKTTDIVSLDASKIIDPGTGLPPILDEFKLEDPLSLGISERVVRKLSTADLLTFTKLEG